MTRTIDEAASGASDLVFPDDATGRYELVEDTVYEAEELRTKLGGDMPQYGDWISVQNEYGDEKYLVAPGALLSELAKASISVNETFQIVSMEQRSDEPSAPYHVQLTFPDRRETSEDQSALGDD